MKFHQLARHQAGAPFGGQHQREMSPIKQQLLLANNLSSSSSNNNSNNSNNNNNNNLTDDEEDDFEDDQPVNFYESLMADQQQQPGGGGQGGPPASGQHQLQDSNGFLMDKNKKLFPQKLWELIHNPSIQHCLRWSQDGQRVYLNRNEFETYYLKTANNQFHTQKAISFVRQMNMYGFRKVDDCYYENDNFRRDQQYLLKNMIRRHPNKGLFVGLDHHQLAAAAAAQQALQVNQQLQQLEHQHKHRAEQALRLNNYLNSHHQFQQQHHHHQSSLQQQHQHQHQQQQQQHHHHHLKHSTASTFDLSTQLAQAAVNHLNQHQQHLLSQRENTNHLIEHQPSPASISTPFDLHQNLNNTRNSVGGQPAAANAGQHQPKKSRLLSNFYASAGANSQAHNNNNNNNQLIANSQDSMHSTSSVDTQPSQCSSAVNSGSAGSPQPNSPKNLQLHQQHQHQPRKSAKFNQASKESNNHLTGSPNNLNNNHVAGNKFAAAAAANGAQQVGLGLGLAGADLSSQSLVAAARQAALHQTLVRSLLQLKHQHSQQQQPPDLLASLQQQQQQQQQQQHHNHNHNHHHNPSRSLLESLASLSSAGTGSIVDPTSNSPTERTATPPSGAPSPSMTSNNNHNHLNQFDDNNDMALDLAKSSSNNNNNNNNNHIKREAADDYDAIDIDVSGDEKDNSKTTDLGPVEGAVDSPLDAAKKVRQFLDHHVKVAGQERHRRHSDSDHCLKRNGSLEDEDEREEDDEDDDQKTHKDIDDDNVNVDVDVDSACNSRSPSPPPPPPSKRMKSSHHHHHHRSPNDCPTPTRSLVASVCQRRGNHLNDEALDEAALYTQCFLDLLLQGASLVAGHSLETGELDLSSAGDSNGTKKEEKSNNKDLGQPIDLTCVSLALKLIPSKLVSSIQRQRHELEISSNRPANLVMAAQVNEPTSSCQDI